MQSREPFYPIHFAIELAVTETAEQYGQLVDKEIETVYELYRAYFLALRQGKNPPEPTSTQKLRGILIDNIWENLIDIEENGKLVRSLTDGSLAPGGRPITSMDEVFYIAFNHLRKSVRFWRKRDGAKGYIRHIAEYVHEAVKAGAGSYLDGGDDDDSFLDPNAPPRVE